MRIVFAGTSEFAYDHLFSLISSGYDIHTVITQPDRPSGRGLIKKDGIVKRLAILNNINVIQPHTFKKDDLPADFINNLENIKPDIMVVVSYGMILPQWVLDLPTFGCVNVHASLLPRWRGAAPIQRAIEYGDKRTGITVIKMDKGLDTGNILFRSSVPILDSYKTLDLQKILAEEGSRAINYVLDNIEKITPELQSIYNITYAKKIEKNEALLDFYDDAFSLSRKIRAFNPFPGAIIRLNAFKDPLKVWDAIPLKNDNLRGVPGAIESFDDEGVNVFTSRGILRLLELQRLGASRSSIKDFINGYKSRFFLNKNIIAK
ncbi:methionyl-tRNA formyltransferase [Candidatus Kinetoplastibacterium blastocrithidii TCC012E]|uniref:Methionyl-tRNA formyltransferase n=1 Tax=Candidatus Kinetoplastidibacterium blastocrithidiae TCC012E TaxID=1208922 RepID=M1LX08_9PROT|nr:methionyl-tRNA formyltransferase [Candidatus Kinetoplastibacterium blastocrithidii]AFZ83248.1 methionyl-tRNA formyltransferase [Candidatus Kinetoplastibacterium blastocrithidii (ex Strigomonas culicis)]AGF50062.1 methionyl-tRNA formyltransferase [Candidatus Kinetoplastibacterium blastocrithidii TCC012E]